jgi:hypothetical protein
MTGSFVARSLRRPRTWAVAGSVLVLVAVGLLTAGLQGSDHPLAPPAPSAAALRATVPTPWAGAALDTLRSVPVTLRIPALGLSVRLGTLGLNADGTVQVPSSSEQAGWFDLGTAPGQLGSAVILGHVDSYQGPGVFFDLRTLAAGDQVDVDLTDGVTAQFTVNAIASYSKQQFPAQRVYGSHGSSALQLVTCGGVFDHATGSYLSNVVVYTALTAVRPPAPPVAR